MTKRDTTTMNPEDNSGLDPEDELVSSTNLSVKCDLSPIALRVAKNPRKVEGKQQGSKVMKDGSKIEDDRDIDVSRAHAEVDRAKLEKRNPPNSKPISKEFVKAASTNMSNIIKGKMIIMVMLITIAPVAQSCINYGTANVTSSIEISNDHETQTYLSHMRVLRYQNKGYEDAIQKEKDINRASEGKREELAKAAELIDSARAGGPSGLVHLGAASDAADRPIEVYNEQGKLMYVVGDTKKGTPAKVEYHEPTDGEDIGHYTLPGGKEPTIRSGGSNMCLYNVLAEQTGKNPDALKDSSLNIMTNNIETFAKQSNDISHLEMHSRMKLASGGAVFNAKNVDETLVYLRNSDGTFGFQNTQKAHPGNHIPFKRTTRDKLQATSDELKKNIEVYHDNGTLLYSVGNHVGGEAIKLEYHKPEGDTSGEYLSSIGGTEKYRLNDPRSPKYEHDTNVWRVVGMQAGKDPKTLKSVITKRMVAKARPNNDAPIEPTTRDKLEATSDELKKNIEVYDAKGKVLYTVGKNVGGKPIKLAYHKAEGQTSGEYLSRIGGTQKYRLNDTRHPRGEEDADFWKLANHLSTEVLKSEVTKRMDAKTVPPKTMCVEKASRDKGTVKGKTGYISEYEAAYVIFHAMQTRVVKNALAKLNQYKRGVKDSDEYVFAEISIPAENLHMSRTAYGAQWENGKITSVWPITGSIVIKLQHYNRRQNDRKAPVQFQTSFPRPPPSYRYLPNDDLS